jgi:competence protein ComEC
VKRPLAVLTIFYCLGIILASFLRIKFWVVMAAGIVVFFAASLAGRKNRVFPILVLFLALLFGSLSFINSYILPKCHISNFVYYKDNYLYYLSGFIDSAPEFKNNQIWFTFRAQEVQVDKLRWHCCGEVLVRIDFGQELNYGDNLILIGNLSRPYNFNAGSRSYKDFLARQGIYLTMSLKDPRQVIRQPQNSGLKLFSNSLWLRTSMEKVIRLNLADLPASVLSAMVLGQKCGIPWLVNNLMIRSGTVHILVVSGFNVGIVAFIINLLFKIVRIPRQARIILVVICLLIYCLVTGATNPVIRATVMGIVFALAYLLKRNPDMYNSLASAALFILIINPRQLFDVGFQLSFVSVLAIVYLYPKLKALIHLESCKIKIWRFICDGLLVSFSAWLGTLGIIAFNFRIISPVTVLANLLIVPLATVITLCGFSLVILGLIYPNLSCLFSVPTSILISLLLNINAALVKLPLAYIYF